MVPEIFDLGISGPEFENNIAIFEISSLKLVGFQNSVKKFKKSKFGTKNALTRYFWAGTSKKLLFVSNQHLRIRKK